MSKTKINDELKKQVRELALKDGLLICYITGEPILGDEYEIDHLIPEALGGSTTIDNLRVVSKRHNRLKSTMSLRDYKIKYEIDKVLNSKDTLRLEDIMNLKKVGRVNFDVTIRNNSLVLDYGGEKVIHEFITCPVTGFKYFYANMPIGMISNDFNGLQPRVIDKKKVTLLSINMRTSPQLLPSIARLRDGKILLFDGQHKASANILNGRTHIDLKIYIDNAGDDKLYNTLMTTNLEAHTTFRQTPFTSGVLLSKMSDVMQEHLKAYMDVDRALYSELGFVEWLSTNKGYSVPDAKKLFKSTMLDGMISTIEEGLEPKLTVDQVKAIVSGLGCDKLLGPKYNMPSEEREQLLANLTKLNAIFKVHKVVKPRTVIRHFSSIVRDALIIHHNLLDSNSRDNVMLMPIDSKAEEMVVKVTNKFNNHPFLLETEQQMLHNGTAAFFISKGLTLQYCIT